MLLSYTKLPECIKEKLDMIFRTSNTTTFLIGGSIEDKKISCDPIRIYRSKAHEMQMTVEFNPTMNVDNGNDSVILVTKKGERITLEENNLSVIDRLLSTINDNIEELIIHINRYTIFCNLVELAS